jgi:hypothetical protein
VVTTLVAVTVVAARLTSFATSADRTILVQDLKDGAHYGHGEISIHHVYSPLLIFSLDLLCDVALITQCESKCLITCCESNTIESRQMNLFSLLIFVSIYKCTLGARVNRRGCSRVAPIWHGSLANKALFIMGLWA